MASVSHLWFLDWQRSCGRKRWRYKNTKICSIGLDLPKRRHDPASFTQKFEDWPWIQSRAYRILTLSCWNGLEWLRVCISLLVFAIPNNSFALLHNRTKENLWSGEISVCGDQWPIFLYTQYIYDPDDPWCSLLRSTCMCEWCAPFYEVHSLYCILPGLHACFHVSKFGWKGA
jgi:hypothetical protein